MTAFYTLSSVVRAVFGIWALLLCLANIANIVLALVKKRYLASALSAILLIPVYFAWQIIFDFSLMRDLSAVAAISKTTINLPWGLWLGGFVSASVFSVLLLGYNARYERNYITPGAIKLFLDKVPCGICCWRSSGKVLFSNICMNELSVSLTDAPLLNGNDFRDALTEEIIAINGKMWRFNCRDIKFGNEVLYEMIASDVTTEYAKTQALEKDKAELSRLNRELKEYTLSIDDAVRRQEILQAKVNIHDEMNKLMLSTVVAESEDAETLDHIFSMWEQNALLLCMEAEETSDKMALSRLEELANALKIHVNWQQPLPSFIDEQQRALFYSAAQEAMANAAKHAAASNMNVYFTHSQDALYCNFENDGEMPTKKVRFSGGLANLASLAKKQNAEILINSDTKFTLTLCLPLKK